MHYIWQSVLRLVKLAKRAHDKQIKPYKNFISTNEHGLGSSCYKALVPYQKQTKLQAGTHYQLGNLKGKRLNQIISIKLNKQANLTNTIHSKAKLRASQLSVKAGIITHIVPDIMKDAQTSFQSSIAHNKNNLTEAEAT